MQLPFRKPGKYSAQKNDPFITRKKYDELVHELNRLKVTRVKAASEVSRLSELGDFSENAEYQLAKGRLRGINDAITRLGWQIDHSEIIESSTATGRVVIGSRVKVETSGKFKIFTILGSAESRPEEGVISYSSPLGSSLLGKEVGDEAVVVTGGKEVVYKVVAIS